MFFCDLFENVSIYGIELWLQPGLDPEDSAPQKSLIFQRFFNRIFMYFLEPFLNRLLGDFIEILCPK